MANIIHSALPNPRRPIIYIEPSLNAKACVSLMTSHNIGALVVCREDKKLIGMLTEREVVRNCVHQGLNPSQTQAQDIAYTEVSILDINDPLEMAMETMTRTKRRHLLVREHGELIAVLSIGDLLFHLLEEKARVIQHLENYIHS